MICAYCGQDNGFHHPWCVRNDEAKEMSKGIFHPADICSLCNIGNGLHHWDCPTGNQLTHKLHANADSEDPFGLDHTQINYKALKYEEGAYEGVIGDWIDKQRAADLCGVFPFQLPSEFPLTPCCLEHDLNYLKTRAEFITKYLEDPTEIDRIASYKPAVESHNQKFYACTLAHLNSQPWFIKPAIRPFVYSFNRLVRELGWTVWVSKTLRDVQDLKDLEG